MILLWQLIFNPYHLFSGWHVRTKSPFAQGRRGRVWDVSTNEVTVLFSWNFPITMLTMLDVSKSTVMSSKASGNNVLSDGLGCTSYSGHSRCGPEGLEGLMAWALLTLVLFACSPHRLIFWHPKYSTTFHQTTDRQPHLNGRTSTRESHHNPGLHTEKIKTFILPWSTMEPDSAHWDLVLLQKVAS